MTALDEFVFSYPCAGCGEPVTRENGVAFWVQTALGKTVLRAHRGECEPVAVASYQEQPVKRIPRPLTREEKQEAAKARKAAEAA